MTSHILVALSSFLAHSLAGGVQCASALIAAFFAAGTAGGLDTSCAATTGRPPFPTAR